MTPEELRAIRERCEAATPGPWEMCDVCVSWQGGWLAHGQPTGTRKAAQADAAFIAHARTDVPMLLDEVERLTRERDEARRIANDAVRELNRANVHAWLDPKEPTP